MRKLSMVITLSILILAGAGTALASDAIEKVVAIKGVSLFTFNTNFFMLQTRKYVYKVNRKNISNELVVKFDRSIESGREMTFDVPRSAITFVWPNAMGLQVPNSKLSKMFKDEAILEDGKVRLRGRSLFSFGDSLALIQVGEAIYQLRKEFLSGDQLSYVENSTPGDRFEQSLPSKSVERVWSIRPATDRHAASVPKTLDEFSVGEAGVKVRGTVLCSFSEPFALIQSKNFIFQIRRSQVLASVLNTLEQPGSKVDLLIPISAIDFAWRAADKEGFSLKKLAVPVL